jgi:single-strand DNA-binding protein
MASLNKLIIEGKLTRDPETIVANSGITICKFAIANNTVSYDTNKQKKEEVIFLDSVAFGKTAEEIAKWFTKGKPIILEGRLKTESWEKEGVKKSKSVLNVKDWYFHGGEKTEQTASTSPDSGQGQRPSPPASNRPSPPQDFADDDQVPF